MKKLSILLAAVLIVAFLVGTPVLAYADEIESGETEGEQANEDETEEETVEVPKEIWEEILEILEQLKSAQSSDDVKDIVENTLGARIREYFGDSWGDVVLAGIFIVASIIIALMNKKKNATLLAGVETVYKTTKSAVKKISKKEDDTALDEIITASADKSASSEKMSRAALEMIKLLVLQSNAKDIVKVEAEKLYQGAVEETKEV
jgi:hypothetical protein